MESDKTISTLETRVDQLKGSLRGMLRAKPILEAYMKLDGSTPELREAARVLLNKIEVFGPALDELDHRG